MISAVKRKKTKKITHQKVRCDTFNETTEEVPSEQKLLRKEVGCVDPWVSTPPAEVVTRITEGKGAEGAVEIESFPFKV